MNIKTQRGISFWSILAIAFVAGFFLLLLIKLFPVYMVDMNVSSSITSLAKEPGAADLSNIELKTKLRKRFEINDVDRSIDINKTLSFESDAGKRIVRISYDSVTPIFNNIFVLIEFDHAEEIGRFVGQ